jgi:hypothetical protein
MSRDTEVPRAPSPPFHLPSIIHTYLSRLSLTYCVSGISLAWRTHNSRVFQPSAMDLQETQRILSIYLHELADLFHRVPGSAILLRYVKSSYQDDPIRSAVELFLFLFAVRYLLAPKYSTKPGVVPLTEDEIDDLVDEWTPEPLVGSPTTLEEMEVDKRTVIVGYCTPILPIASAWRTQRTFY